MRLIRLFSVSLCSIFLFTSCFTTERSLGTDLIPSDQDLTLYTATFEAPLRTQSPDSLPMSGSSLLVFGSINTPEFGTTTVGSAFQIIPTTSGTVIGPSPVFKDCRLQIPMGSRTYLLEGESSMPQNIFVYQLKNDIELSGIYNKNFGPEDYYPEPINKSGNVYFGGDTLNIMLKESFAGQFLQTTDLERDSVQLFAKRFKGLFITTKEQSTEGGCLNYATADDAYIYLHYTSQGGDSTRTFFINTNENNYNVSRHSSQSLETLDPAQTVYYEGLGGVKPYLDIKALAQDLHTWAKKQNIEPSNILISRAELVVRARVRTDDNYFELNHYPDSLYPCYRASTDTTHSYFPVTDLNTDSRAGVLNRTKFQYEFNIGATIQELFHKDPAELREHDNLFIMPYSSFTNSYYGTSYTLLNNYSYTQAKFFGNTSAEAPYLKITYAVLK